MPYQEAPTPPMTPALRAACRDSVHVLTIDGRTVRAGRAGLLVLEELGFAWLTRWLVHPPQVWIVEVAYRIVAGNRRLFGRFLFRRE